MRVLPDEYDIVCQMQVIDREVFFYLAQRTDGQTGVIGKRCRVSYGGMALDLSERASPGRRNGLMVFSSTDMRNSVERLVKCGIFKRFSKVGQGNNLLLRREILARFLTTHNSDQKQVSRRLVGYLSGDSSENSNENNDMEQKKTRGCQDDSNEVSRTNIHQYQHRDGKPGKESVNDVFSMNLEWKPSENELRMILFRAGGSQFKVEAIDPAWVSEFVAYWWGQQGRQLSQQQWTAKLANQIIKYFKTPGYFEQCQGIRPQDLGQQKRPAEANSRNLPDWARMPKSDDDLVNWARRHGYGEAQEQHTYRQFREALREKVNVRLREINLAVRVH